MTIAQSKPVLGRLVTLALCLLAASSVLRLQAADRPEFSADAAFFSQYNWRGLVVTDGPVLQPALTMTYAGFSANVWGNLDLDDANDLAGKFNEVDLTFSYSGSVGKAELTTGVINYIFPNIPADATTEIFGAIGFDVPLNPSFGAYFDVDEVDGTYLTADVSHTVDFQKTSSGVATAFTLGTGLGWASGNYALGYFGVADSGLMDFRVTASLGFTIAERFTIAPSIAYVSIVDSSLRDAVASADNLWGGVTLSLTF